MSGIAERLATLARQVTGVDLRLASIADERKSVAVEASQGGRTALQKIAALDAEEDQLKRSKTTYTLAADELDGMLRAEEAAVAAGQREARAAKAREIGAAVCALNVELDDLLGRVRETCERRENMVNALRRETGAIDSRTAFRLVSKEVLSSAAAHAGLNKFIALESVPISSVRPLADANRILPH